MNRNSEKNNSTFKSYQFQKGDKHRLWKGGKILSSDGYYLIYSPHHPKANYSGYVREHRLIYEKFYNVCLLSITFIHHKNDDKLDNRIENLEPVFLSRHNGIHKKKDMSNRICLICNSKTTLFSSNKFRWYCYENGFICHKCYISKK